MSAIYDTIGINYSDLRRPDPRIGASIQAALGGAQRIINVGAGAGSYEPTDREVLAIEPSSEMISQRPESAAPVIQAQAEAIPLDDDSYDAAMAILTIHHWADKAQGLSEMRRVATGPIVLLTYDPAFRGFWLADYLPELITQDEGVMPTMGQFEDWLGPVEISEVPVPFDCSDGFLYAYWRRPAAYLDEEVRKAISAFWALGDVTSALDQLRDDLESGAWEARYGRLMELDSLDCGYRLVRTL